MRRGISTKVAAITAIAAALTAVLPGLTADAADQGKSAQSGAAPPWKLKLAISYFPSAGHHSQYDTVLAAGHTGWFFGGSNYSGHGVPEAETRQHDRWRQSVLPHGLRSWITGASAVSPGDIWAATYLGGSVLHWDGATWAVQPKGGWTPKAVFTGVTATGPRNVWLFGAKGSSSQGAGTWHLTGSKWVKVKGVAGDIDKASAVSATDIWAIGGVGGSLNAVLQLRGANWHRVTPAALDGFSYSAVLAVSASDVWVAGTVAGSPELGHYDGHAWTVATVPSATPVSAMCRDGRGGLWVIANPGAGPSGLLDRSASGQWKFAKVSSTSANEVFGCALIPGTKSAWGVGKASAPKGTAAAVYGYGPTP
jgi:hypothetical protein